MYTTSRKACKILGVHANTLRRMADTGKIKHYKLNQDKGDMMLMTISAQKIKSNSLYRYDKIMGTLLMFVNEKGLDNKWE